MVKTYKTKLKFLLFLKYTSALIASMYLFGWIVEIFKPELFIILDEKIGFFPAIINNIYYLEVDLKGMDIPMGYVYASLIVILFALLFQFLERKIKTKLENFEKDDIVMKYIVSEKKEPLIKPIIKNSKYIYGLFELEFEIFNNQNREDEFLRLKKEYSRMLVEKLNQKYPKITYASSDKAFFMIDDIEVFDYFILDVLEIYKIFAEINNTKNIKTKLLFSFVDSNQNNPKYYCYLLNKINGLKNYNKVIIADNLITMYENIKNKQFSAIPLGEFNIEIAKNNDINIELGYLKK